MKVSVQLPMFSAWFVWWLWKKCKILGNKYDVKVGSFDKVVGVGIVLPYLQGAHFRSL